MLNAYDIAGIIEAGTDEAGRGCIAGPVYAAAVILPGDFEDPGLNDSKQLSRKARERLRDYIQDKALTWAVASASPEEIDEINILQASILSMHRALDALKVRPQHIIVDGNRFRPYGDIPFRCYVKGDGRYASIAAASILAKTYRDDCMRKAAELYPQYGWERNFGYPTAEHRSAVAQYGITPLYGWERNFGYPTAEHRSAVAQYGITPLHRRSFQILPDPTLF